MNIFFVCNWGEDTNQLRKRMELMTPNNKGIWKNIKSVNNIKEADYVVALSYVPNNIKFNPNKIIIFPREPSFTYNPSLKYKYFFTYDNMYHVVTQPQFIQMDYDTLANLKYNGDIKTKVLSSVTSMKLHTKDAIQRVKIITNLCHKYPNIIDVYGSHWDNRLHNNYKGILGFYHNTNNKETTKYDGLKNYKYSLCLENCSKKNYFSEKFTDCILSWTIPIYYGCPNIDEYFPKDCYYKIDIYNPNSLDRILNIINKPITDDNIKALSKARDLILNKYNVWDTISRIIKN